MSIPTRSNYKDKKLHSKAENVHNKMLELRPLIETVIVYSDTLDLYLDRLEKLDNDDKLTPYEFWQFVNLIMGEIEKNAKSQMTRFKILNSKTKILGKEALKMRNLYD